MKFVPQTSPLYVCQLPGLQYPNHAGLTRVIGWVHTDGGKVGMLCSYDDKPLGRVHAVIPFNPEEICALGRNAELAHAF